MGRDDNSTGNLTNKDIMDAIFGKEVTDSFQYYLTHVLTNSDVTEKFQNWLQEEYRR